MFFYKWNIKYIRIVGSIDWFLVSLVVIEDVRVYFVLCVLCVFIWDFGSLCYLIFVLIGIFMNYGCKIIKFDI